MNRYPFWKYLLILAVLAIGVIYAMPNLYPPDPAVQISGQRGGMVIEQTLLERAGQALDKAGIDYKSLEADGGTGLIRLRSQDLQLQAKRVVQQAVGGDFVVALNLAPTTPDWLSGFGAQPMKLGLDLAGGVHFLLEVDIDAAVNKRLATLEDEFQRILREERIRYRTLRLTDDGTLNLTFKDADLRDRARQALQGQFNTLQFTSDEPQPTTFALRARYTEAAIDQIEDDALKQNLTALRNRVNELGVSEPLVQRQGANQIVVQLPGIQDTAEAKRIIGKTAELEFRIEAAPDALATSKQYFEFRNPERERVAGAYLQKKIIVTGENVTSASTGYDENGMPQVNIGLDGQGGAKMNRATRDNVGERMGVVFIEYKTRLQETTDAEGNTVFESVPYVEKHLINLATIQSALGVNFRITGLDSPTEASELALLLRAGALAAPMYFVEERTIGPSLGAENIQAGIQSVLIGGALVLVCMLVIYKLFGIFANVALVANLVLLIAAMSLFGATLTLPGIAGIVLTVGMAVDANVLIFARIREELRNGVPVQSAINAGYDRAFLTILDANITTLIVALILFAVGTGPVQGFAVTLSIGILTSMFTAIMGTRALVNLTLGNRPLKRLWI